MDGEPHHQPNGAINITIGEESTLASRMKRLAGELGKFGTVGAFGFLVNVVVFNLCLYTFQLASVRSGVIATFVAICFNYVGHRYWTYQDSDKHRVRREATLFLVFSGFGMAIENGVLALSHYGFGFTSALADNIAKNVVGLGVASVFRFWSFRTWVFRSGAQTSGGWLFGLAAEKKRENRRMLLK